MLPPAPLLQVRRVGTCDGDWYSSADVQLARSQEVERLDPDLLLQMERGVPVTDCTAVPGMLVWVGGGGGDCTAVLGMLGIGWGWGWGGLHSSSGHAGMGWGRVGGGGTAQQ